LDSDCCRQPIQRTTLGNKLPSKLVKTQLRLAYTENRPIDGLEIENCHRLHELYVGAILSKLKGHVSVR